MHENHCAYNHCFPHSVLRGSWTCGSAVSRDLTLPECSAPLLKTSGKAGSVALPRRVVALWPLAAFVALHLGPKIVERPRTQHRQPLADHLERHPHRALAALASDPRIALGLKLGDGAGVGHGSIRAWPDTRSKDEWTMQRIAKRAECEIQHNPSRSF
jgi:hypothetical protein